MAWRQQAIAWANVDPHLCGHMASPGHNELIHLPIVPYILYGLTATSHCLSQCWPPLMWPYGITRPQWVNPFTHCPIHMASPGHNELIHIPIVPSILLYGLQCILPLSLSWHCPCHCLWPNIIRRKLAALQHPGQHGPRVYHAGSHFQEDTLMDHMVRN